MIDEESEDTEAVEKLKVINDSIKSGLDIIPVSRMDEVLARALVRKPEPITWEEATAKPVDVPETIEEDASGLTAHWRSATRSE